MDRVGCLRVGLALQNLWHFWTHMTLAAPKEFPLRNGLAV